MIAPKRDPTGFSNGNWIIRWGIAYETAAAAVIKEQAGLPCSPSTETSPRAATFAMRDRNREDRSRRNSKNNRIA
jgi:hypothetical protein